MVREWSDAKSGGPDPGPAANRDRWRPAWAEVDVDALRHNTALLGEVVRPSTVCAVVKANGYGHGASTVARAALAGGAVGVAVALVEEGARLREAQYADPILLLSEPPPGSEDEVVALGLEPTVDTVEGVRRLADAARRLGHRVAVHVKVDTGMHRVGAPPEQVVELCQTVADAAPSLSAAGLWTHLAVAEGSGGEDRAFTQVQLQRFEEVRGDLRRQNLEPRVLHAANSAGAIAVPQSRYQMVRCGIALYGYSPSPAVSEALSRQLPGAQLRPALSLKARVSSVRELPAGASPSYGRLRPLPERSSVATVPLGYADGVPRRLFETGGEVLIGGRRRPLAGMVTMDHLVVDCGHDAVAVGDEVVLIGRQHHQQITAEEWARRLGTISYEVLTGIGPRVPRVILGTEASAEQAPDDQAPPSPGRITRWVKEARLH